MIADRSNIKLHPVNSPYVAIRSQQVIEEGEEKSAVSYDELEKPSKEAASRSRTTSGAFKISGDLYIHPTGYYFTKEVYLRRGAEEETVGLKNILSNDHSHSTELDPDLDIMTLCVLSQTAREHVICAFNRKRNAIRVFHLEPTDAFLMDIGLPHGFGFNIKPSNTFEYKGKKVEALSFHGYDHIFSSMVTVEDPADSTKTCLVVAYTNGRVKLYRDFVEIEELKAPSENGAQSHLFSNGKTLAIHTEGQNFISFRNIADKSGCSIPFYPYRKLRLSADGKYLTALANQDQSDLVHCIDMAMPEYRNIKLKSPVTDFVVGGKHNTAMSVNAKGEVKIEGTLETLLMSNQKQVKKNFFDRYREKEDATEKKGYRPN